MPHIAGLIAALCVALRPDAPASAQRAPTAADPARRVILYIGDGMGDSEITLARYYTAGAAGRLAMDTLPFTGTMTTYAVMEDDPARPVYVPDSAATATAWLTGTKTSNGRISTEPRTDRVLRTIVELAQERGLRTGDVTTAELTDATPAAPAAHVAHRSCQGPADMQRCPQNRKRAGGLGAIAEHLVDRQVDVLLGGGARRFEQRTDAGQTVLESASAHGYQIVTNAAMLKAVSSGRLLGLFAPGNMTPEWTGREALPYPSNVTSPQICQTSGRPTNEPNLSEMTAKALDVLGADDRGFFLQVEGASIDKESHAANPCGQIGETIALDRAILVGLEYAAAHPDTLIIVTGDHGHSGQIVGTPTDADHPTGLLSVLLTKDGSPLTVSYATNGYHRAQDHTGTQIRVAARGPQGAAVRGVIDQTDLFRLISRALQLSGSTTASPA
jgi:alkaline phosphatase